MVKTTTKSSKKKVVKKKKAIKKRIYTKVGMKLTPQDWDINYEEDMANGIGFDIDDPNGINKNNVRSPRGIYSNQYGADISDDADYQSIYSCKCGKVTGAFFADGKTKCPDCGSFITSNNDVIERTGWITLREDLHMINPLYYYMIEKVIGKKNLNNIIYYNKDRDEDGNIIVNYDYMDENNPFFNIGMKEFYERFDEIIEYYVLNMKGKQEAVDEKMELVEFLKLHKEKIFANHFPVYTLLLRPIMLIKNNMIYATINTKYQSLLVNVCDLNKEDVTMDSKDLKILPLMYQTQLILNQIHRLTISEQLSGKEGYIRNSMLGRRVNFSSRCVIIPLLGKYDIDQIKVPYVVFLELYKYELINLLCKTDKLTISEAIERWNEATQKFDKKIYLLMKYLIEHTKGGCRCFINRNPSLNHGSILTMHIVDVKDDFYDLTLSIPLNVLGVLAADFDGDVINLISLKTQEFVREYDDLFNPKSMMIDRNNGYFNRKMNLVKDQMIGLYSFCKD